MRGRDYSLLEAPRSRRNFGRMVGKEEVTAREPGFPEVNRSLPCFSALSWSRNGLQGDQWMISSKPTLGRFQLSE
jgi:hypothetical protein